MYKFLTLPDNLKAHFFIDNLRFLRGAPPDIGKADIGHQYNCESDDKLRHGKQRHDKKKRRGQTYHPNCHVHCAVLGSLFYFYHRFPQLVGGESKECYYSGCKKSEIKYLKPECCRDTGEKVYDTPKI